MRGEQGGLREVGGAGRRRRPPPLPAHLTVVRPLSLTPTHPHSRNACCSKGGINVVLFAARFPSRVPKLVNLAGRFKCRWGRSSGGRVQGGGGAGLQEGARRRGRSQGVLCGGAAGHVDAGKLVSLSVVAASLAQLLLFACTSGAMPLCCPSPTPAGTARCSGLAPTFCSGLRLGRWFGRRRGGSGP